MTRFATCLLALLVLSPLSAQEATPDRAAVDLDRFLQELDALRQTARIPGLSVALVKDQELILARGLGLADLEQRIPATAETAYNIASVTKPLSAVVALRLAEDGVLDLDRPIATYSGWAEFCRDFSQAPSIFARDLRCDPAPHTLRHLLSHTAAGRPGERFSYNPVLFSWASRPIAAAAGTPFSALVERHVFQPAAMTRSARIHRELPLPAHLAEALAPPHRVDSGGALVRAPDPPPQGDGAAGGVVSSVVDLAKFDVALDSGRLLSPASRAAMMTPTQSAAGTALPYGIGWYVQEYRGYTLLWHSGWWEEAYSALYLKVPAQSLTMILLANSEGLWWDNPLEKAEVENSPFAQLFLRTFVDAATVGEPLAPTIEGFTALLEALASAWNEGDAARAADCFTPDAVYLEPPAKQLYRGRQALFEFFGGNEGRPGQMSMRWHHLAFSPETQVGFGEFSFTYGTTAHGVAVVRLRDGKIANWREYWYESELPWAEFVRENPF